MYFSKLFGKTLKEIPAEADSLSHQLLVRAGMIQQVAAGIYAYLPMGWRVLRKIENIIRQEMDNAGGQELMMPSLQPLDLWEKSGRLPSFGKTIFTITDRKDHKLAHGRDFALPLMHILPLDDLGGRVESLPHLLLLQGLHDILLKGGVLGVTLGPLFGRSFATVVENSVNLVEFHPAGAALHL